MAEKIVIVQLDLDESAFLEGAKKTKDAILELKKAQALLKIQGKENSTQFIKNDTDLKRLNTTYLNQKKAIIALESPYAKLSNRLIRAKKEFKDLAATHGVNNKRLDDARRKVIALDNQLKKIDKSVGDNQRSVGKYSDALKGVTARFTGAALAAAGFLAIITGIIRGIRDAIRRVIAFDKQLIAVGKTTDLSKKALKDFGRRVILLGKELKGISTQSLLETAEVAGQLGIRGSENILKFAATLQKLALTSDIIGQDAARNFAKFIEVSSDSVENADRLGSVITRLGNNFATTESQILKSTTEIQKGIAIYNTSAESVIALGTATSALGSQAEASRGALQKTFNVLNKGATTGENLEKILRLTGQTQSEFIEEFGTDAIATFQKFIKGLSDSSDRGENLSNTLNDLGLTQLRVSAVVGSLAKNYDVLEEAMEQANDEYETNTALNIEAEAASKSLSSQIGDLSDAWGNLILNIENGDGALAKFTRSAIIGLTGVVDAFDIASTASDGFFEFFLNLQRFATGAGGQVIIANAEKQALKEFNIAKNELLDLLAEEAKLRGVLFIRETQDQLLEQDSIKNLRLQIKQIELKKKAEVDALKVSEDGKKEARELTKEEQKAADKRAKEQRDKEKRDLIKFEQEKIDIQNEIDLRKLETEQEKAEEKLEQKLEKDLKELEDLEITQTQKDELELLLLQNHTLALQEIQDNATADKEAKEQKSREKIARLRKQFDRQDIVAEKALARAKQQVLTAGVNVLRGILGDSILVRLAEIFFKAKADIAGVQIATTASQARNIAQATSAAPPPFNVPLILNAQKQNVGLGITSKIAQGKILSASVLSGAGAIAQKAFYEGGQIRGDANIPVGMRNRGGDDVIIQAKRGEIILNESQQARAGGAGFFSSIGVPGFAEGGQITNDIARNVTNEQLGTNEILDSLDKVRIVAIVDDIREGVNKVVEIEEGANI